MTPEQTQPHDEFLTVADLALLLKCKQSSIYNLTRTRGQVRYHNPIPVLRLPCGLRFKRSSVLAWFVNKPYTSLIRSPHANVSRISSSRYWFDVRISFHELSTGARSDASDA